MMKDKLNVASEQSLTLAPLVSGTHPFVTLSLCVSLSLLVSRPFFLFLSFLLLNGNIIIEDSTS